MNSFVPVAAGAPHEACFHLEPGNPVVAHSHAAPATGAAVGSPECCGEWDGHDHACDVGPGAFLGTGWITAQIEANAARASAGAATPGPFVGGLWNVTTDAYFGYCGAFDEDGFHAHHDGDGSVLARPCRDEFGHEHTTTLVDAVGYDGVARPDVGGYWNVTAAAARPLAGDQWDAVRGVPWPHLGGYWNVTAAAAGPAVRGYWNVTASVAGGVAGGYWNFTSSAVAPSGGAGYWNLTDRVARSAIGGLWNLTGGSTSGPLG